MASMAFHPLKSFFPTADALLTLDLPRLGEILLVHLKSYEGRVYQNGLLNRGYLLAMLENKNVGLGPLPKEPEYGARQPEVTQAVMEAWNWLERDGMLIPDPNRAGWHSISRRGEELLNRYGKEGQALSPAGKVASTSDGPDSTTLTAEDRKFAKLAIDEARKSVAENDGRTHPKVGVVVVKDNQVLGSAHRGEIPKCHAEYIVLEQKLADMVLVGTTVYTTLEPCTARNHPKVPCAKRLVERRVGRVVIGMLDPNPEISGRGQRELRRAGITTDFFPNDLMTEVEELNREFIRAHETRSDGALKTLSDFADWEVRYPGGLDDVSMIRQGPSQKRERFAVATDFSFVNKSPHQVSLGITLLIAYGSTQLAVEPRKLALPEWERLLEAFGIPTKPQLVFPLNLPGRSSVDGHILFPIRTDGQGNGIGGDVPEKRTYLFEIEDLLTRKTSTLSASAVFARDKNYHQRISPTDLALAGPNEEPLTLD